MLNTIHDSMFLYSLVMGRVRGGEMCGMNTEGGGVHRALLGKREGRRHRREDNIKTGLQKVR
jgi:hypothetical protein